MKREQSPEARYHLRRLDERAEAAYWNHLLVPTISLTLLLLLVFFFDLFTWALSF